MINTIERLRILEPGKHGLYLVQDMPSRQYFELYKPFTPAQIAAGHVERRWYFRPTSWVKDGPASSAFDSFDLALAGLHARQQLKDLIDGHRNPSDPPARGQ